MFVAADFVLGIVCALLTDFETLCVGFGKWIIILKVGGKLWQREGYMEQYLSDRNQLHIFDNNNFSIIPKSIFSDNDNLPISCKNTEISAVDNFFANITYPYLQLRSWRWSLLDHFSSEESDFQRRRRWPSDDGKPRRYYHRQGSSDCRGWPNWSSGSPAHRKEEAKIDPVPDLQTKQNIYWWGKACKAHVIFSRFRLECMSFFCNKYIITWSCNAQVLSGLRLLVTPYSVTLHIISPPCQMPD